MEPEIDPRVIALQKAQANIIEYQNRITLLEGTNPVAMTDDKIREFINNNQSWYPAHAIYGHLLTASWVSKDTWSYYVLSFREEINIAEFGKKKAEEDMVKFKAFLQQDFINEIGKIRELIAVNQRYIESNTKK